MVATVTDDTLPTAIAAKWALAELTPGVPVDLGDVVVCDLCGADYRGLPHSGGFIVGGTAVCPMCEPTYLLALNKHNEQHHIRARCPAGTTFHAFVLAYRAEHGCTSIVIRRTSMSSTASPGSAHSAK